MTDPDHRDLDALRALDDLSAFLARSTEEWGKIVRTAQIREKIAALDPLLGLVADRLSNLLADDAELVPEIEAAVDSLAEVIDAVGRMRTFVDTRISVSVDRLVDDGPADRPIL